MENSFINLEHSALLDMLSENTARYTQLLTAGGLQKEIDECKLLIQQIQMEIERRKKEFSDNSTMS